VGAKTQIALIMARGYANVLVVLAVGFVFFVVIISILALQEPVKGQAFLNNFMGPALALVSAYAFKTAHEYLAAKK
jgi:hypothetical protein